MARASWMLLAFQFLGHGGCGVAAVAHGEDYGGTLVAQESAEESDTEITLPTGQVYIVKVANKVVKIGM